MLPAENRLKNRKDFQRVFKYGRGFSIDSVFLKIKEKKTKTSRFGFVISRKATKKAVVRNKMRRHMQVSVQELLPRIKKPADMVFIVRSAIKKSNYKEIKQLIGELLLQARVF